MSSKGVWSLAKWGSKRSTLPREIPKLPALEIKGQKTKAVTFEAKVKVLQETFFPPPLNADLDDIAGTRYPPPLSMNDIDEKEVIQAINRPAQDKAPGVNGIPNRFLRAVAGELCSHIRHLFQACLRMGHHPKRFKEANTVVLKKPKKSDYSQPKSYRPIALLDTLGKAFETRERLRNLLPEEQMRARRGRSVETALETITEAVHTIWNCNKNIVASLLSLNGAGAFDNVSHARLLHNLRMKGEKLPGRSGHLDNTRNEDEPDDRGTDGNPPGIPGLSHSVSLLQRPSHRSVHKGEPPDRRVRRRCSAARLRQKHGTELRSSEQGTRDLPKVGAPTGHPLHRRNTSCFISPEDPKR